jgi:hypothetical protein
LEGLGLNKDDFNRLLSYGRNIALILSAFVVISGLIITISEGATQQDKNWIWSVTPGDIEGYGKSSSDSYRYMINHGVNISWTIIPSNSSEIIDTTLKYTLRMTINQNTKPIQ